MNKKELIEKVARQTGLSKKDSADVLDEFIAVISDELVNGNPVKLIGFGSFEIYERAERRGRNLQTGEDILIPAKKAIKFKPSKNLKNLVSKIS